MRFVRRTCRPCSACLALCISSPSSAFTSSSLSSASSFSLQVASRQLQLPSIRGGSLQSPPSSSSSSFLVSRTCRGKRLTSTTSTIRKMTTSSSSLDSGSTEEPSNHQDNNIDKKKTKKNTLRVALCQFHVTENMQVNHATCRDYLQQAAAADSQLVVLPEIWASPYATAAFPDYAQVLPSVVSNDDSNGNEPLSSSSAELLRQAAREFNYWIVGGSLAEKSLEDDNKIYNTCLVFNPQGQVVAKHRKVHLFDINVPGGVTFFESQTLSPGNSPTHFDLTIPDNNNSISVVVRIGIGICYDIRFAAYSMLLRHHYNCQILIFPGAFNLTTGPAHWELLQRARAVDNQCFVLTASPARSAVAVVNDNDDQKKKTSSSKYPPYTAWGHSTAVSPWGTVLATTDEKPSIVMVDLDLDTIPVIRKSLPIAEQERKDIYQVISTSTSAVSSSSASSEAAISSNE